MKRMLEVSFLLGAVLVVAVFTKGNVRDFLIVGITLSWLIANICVLLKPKMMAFVEDFKIKLYSKILMESKNDILVYPATEETKDASSLQQKVMLWLRIPLHRQHKPCR